MRLLQCDARRPIPAVLESELALRGLQKQENARKANKIIKIICKCRKFVVSLQHKTN